MLDGGRCAGSSRVRERLSGRFTGGGHGRRPGGRLRAEERGGTRQDPDDVPGARENACRGQPGLDCAAGFGRPGLSVPDRDRAQEERKEGDEERRRGSCSGHRHPRYHGARVPAIMSRPSSSVSRPGSTRVRATALTSGASVAYRDPRDDWGWHPWRGPPPAARRRAVGMCDRRRFLAAPWGRTGPVLRPRGLRHAHDHQRERRRSRYRSAVAPGRNCGAPLPVSPAHPPAARARCPAGCVSPSPWSHRQGAAGWRRGPSSAPFV